MALAISVLEELRRTGLRFEYLPGPWVRVSCPFHDDKTPSCDVCTDGSGGFKCHGCAAHGDFITFLARLLKAERWVIIHDLNKRYGDLSDKTVEIDVIEKYHQKLWKAEALLIELRKRGVTDDQIREFRLGENAGRVTIPVKNVIGAYVNVIAYAPGAPERKFQSLKGRGVARIFPIEQLSYKKLMLLGGPIKAIAASTKLNAAGIGAVCTTVGETNWDLKLNASFQDKDTCVCYDIDKAGLNAMEERCAHLYPFASKVGKSILPLDIRDHPKGDMNDFMAIGGDPVAVYEAAKIWSPPKPMLIDESEPTELGLSESYLASYSQKRVAIKAQVAAVDQSAYHLPKAVAIKCDRKQNQCGICPVFGLPVDPVITLPPESSLMLELMGEPTSIQSDRMTSAIGVPPCDVVKFEVQSYYHVEDARISPELDIASRASHNQDSAFVAAVCIDAPIELNETYHLTGKMMPHPKTQSATLVVGKSKPAVDSLSSFSLEKPGDLRVFQPSASHYDSLCDKLDHIWGDAEQRVTRIYGRRELHTAIDLAYFSTLLVPNRSEHVKGWVEVLIVGDSSQGKSEATAKMANYYGLGEKVECKNATVAGLVGGLQQLGSKGRWFIKWGVFPNNDRRLVILEELKGLSREAFARLTDMRSSGIADIPKIERRRTHARTRIIANSNPRSNRPVSAYNYGVDTIRELIPSLEDIRRFDLCIVLNREDVDVAKLQGEKHDASDPHYDRDLSRKLVLWAWTRQKGQVHFTPECDAYLAKATQTLCETFVDDLPILDRGSTRHKLARLATSVACRSFSTDDTYVNCIVHERHAQYACDFVLKHYSSKSSGYLEFSDYTKSRGKMQDSSAILLQLLSAPHSRSLAAHMLNTSDIEHQDICDWCGWDRLEALPLVSCLVRNGALRRDGRCYRKTPEFITLLQKALESGALNVPEHLKPKVVEKF